MKPITHESSNFTIKAPHGQEDICDPLPVTRCTIGNMPAQQSYWELSQQELDDIARTKTVRLTVFGLGHPMVMLEVEQPRVLGV